MKIILLLFIGCTFSSYGQGFNEDKTAFSNFIKRMYTAAPFEGVKIVDDYDHQYLVSVISLEKAKYTNDFKNGLKEYLCKNKMNEKFKIMLKG